MQTRERERKIEDGYKRRREGKMRRKARSSA